MTPFWKAETSPATTSIRQSDAASPAAATAAAAPPPASSDRAFPCNRSASEVFAGSSSDLRSLLAPRPAGAVWSSQDQGPTALNRSVLLRTVPNRSERP